MIWLYSKRVARSEPPQLMSHSLKPFQCHSRVSKLFYLLSMKTIRMVYVLLLCKVPESLHEATTFYNCKIQYMRSCNTVFSWSKVKVKDHFNEMSHVQKLNFFPHSTVGMMLSSGRVVVTDMQQFPFR